MANPRTEGSDSLRFSFFYDWIPNHVDDRMAAMDSLGLLMISTSSRKNVILEEAASLFETMNLAPSHCLRPKSINKGKQSNQSSSTSFSSLFGLGL